MQLVLAALSRTVIGSKRSSSESVSFLCPFSLAFPSDSSGRTYCLFRSGHRQKFRAYCAGSRIQAEDDQKMTRRQGSSKEHIKNTKAKSGCVTCRIRKIKCDEKKPSCRRCVSTGRTCDGYNALYKHYTLNPAVNTRNLAVTLRPGAEIIQRSFEISPLDIELLGRCFSTKTLLDVKLGCDAEAEKVLKASLTDPAIRDAILSLKALRQDLETPGQTLAYVTQHNPSYSHGLQQYSRALGGLASDLSFPTHKTLRSALFCCQIFISIEQVRGNYGAMAQHIIAGLDIMQEYRARPCLAANDMLTPACSDELPLVDVFVMKLFAAPCLFTETRTTENKNLMCSAITSSSSRGDLAGSSEYRKIAPDMRTELKMIGALITELLENVSQFETVEDALLLLPKKTALLDSLATWYAKLDDTLKNSAVLDSEPISTSFLRYFHAILEGILLRTLYSSPEEDLRLQAENERLRRIAYDIGERVKSYNILTRTSTRSESCPRKS